MSRRLETVVSIVLWASGATMAQTDSRPGPYPGIARPATPAEVKAWDIDVRPDFKGLPAGSGTVAKGMEVWESKCASCHGVFGESNEVFAPLVGGTTAQDILTGRAARLNDPSFPGRTTFMKLSSLSTLWDYIHRAMPWNAPKSLTIEEVYGVTAYMLHLGGIVAGDYTLSDRNMAEVQKRLPNRAGMTTDHALWPGTSAPPGGRGRKPDVAATACMKDCGPEPALGSLLPDFARNAHGNLAEQSRPVGAQRGADTSKPPGAAVAAATPAPAKPAANTPPAAVALAQKYTCTACHGMDNKIVGPGFREIADKYRGRSDTASYLLGKIKNGSTDVWGAIAMPPQPLGDADAKSLAQWLADGARK